MSKKRLDFKRMLDDTDFSDPSSIERYAANLDGMTFRDILELGIAPEGESAPKDFGSKKYDLFRSTTTARISRPSSAISC